MISRKLYLPTLVIAVLSLAATLAWAEGLILGETKQQLGMDYDVTVQDPGNGHVTVTLTLVNEGRLKPIHRIELDMLSSDKHPGGGFMSDLSVALAATEAGGKRVVSVHLRKEWAERAEFHLLTASLDGKQEKATYYIHAIPIAKFMKTVARPAN